MGLSQRRALKASKALPTVDQLPTSSWASRLHGQVIRAQYQWHGEVLVGDDKRRTTDAHAHAP